VSHVLDGGVHAVFPVGETSEFHALDEGEKERTISIVVDEVKGRVPVYAGTGAASTRQVIRETKAAKRAGASGVVIITPFVIKLSQEELYAHYADIAASTDLPIILYENQPATGNHLEAETVGRLARIENIVSIKDSSWSIDLTSEYVEVTKGENFAVLSGIDTLFYSALAVGATGTIMAFSNLAPRIAVEIYDAFMAGDHKRALAAQTRLSKLRPIFTLGEFHAAMKAAGTLLGLEVGNARKPIAPFPAEKTAVLRKALEEMGLLTAQPAR
jgi:4-hydroxy-tetrahydrodipicolinate synthase